MAYLLPGDTAPWFKAPALDGNPNFAFDTVGGRYVMLLFFGAASDEEIGSALEMLAQYRALFDDRRACFFGVVNDSARLADKRIAQNLPGIRFFLDYEGNIARLYGDPEGNPVQAPCWILLDPTMRVMGVAPIEQGDVLLKHLRALLAAPAPEAVAPILIVPHVFEPAFCRNLIAYYEAHGGEDSGFMREVNGKTTVIVDPSHKKRQDCVIEDKALVGQARARLVRFLRPQIERAFQFQLTRIERWIVASYGADSGGYFRPHRDNMTKGTAHRRFACSINLNAEEYEGGDLCFPEYGDRLYRAPTGGAVIFSCSLLHEARPVTSGRRYAFLPFFYDEAAAAQREANNVFLSEGVGAYSRDTSV
jgi:predicted 2-oxoglutarate/Fe(II)-dependent dioxygenase YbiX/peroxiredoxin